MKKIASVTLSLLMVFLVSCSRTDEKTTETKVEPTKGMIKKTVVNVWAHQGQESEVKAIKKIIAEFNMANNKIFADLTIIPSGFKHSYETKITSAKLSGKLPDVLDIDGPFVAQYAWSNVLQPIDKFVSKAMRNDFLPSIIKQGTYKGKLFTLGAFESGMGLYYNKKLVQEFGITTTNSVDNAWNWNKLLTNLYKVNKKGIYPLSLSMEWGPGEWYTYAFLPFIWSSGQNSVFSADGSTTSGYLNSNNAMEGMRKFQLLFTNKLAPATPPPDLFEQGKAVFAINGHWMMSKYSKTEGLEWGLMPLPYIKNQVVPSGSWCWGISKQSKNKAEAFEVLSWIVGSKTGVIPMVKANNAIPARLSAIKLMPEFGQQPRKIFVEQLKKYAHPRPITPAYGVFSEKFASAVKNISLGQNPREQLGKSALAIDKVLNERKNIKE